jgi:hypothetical protein
VNRSVATQSMPLPETPDDRGPDTLEAPPDTLRVPVFRIPDAARPPDSEQPTRHLPAYVTAALLESVHDAAPSGVRLRVAAPAPAPAVVPPPGPPVELYDGPDMRWVVAVIWAVAFALLAALGVFVLASGQGG